MGYLIPVWQLKNGDASLFRSAVIKAMIYRATALGIGNQHELVVDDLTPADLGLKSWNIILPQGNNVWVDHKIEPNRIIGIYKVIQLGKWSKINTMKIKRDSIIVSHYSMAQLYIYGQEGFFSEPSILYSSLKISLEMDGNNKSGEKLALGGFVLSKIEPK